MSNQIIQTVLTELSLHPNVDSGVIDFSNQKHIEALNEVLINLGVDEEIAINISEAVAEGKFPDRQAFNKEGWLVTFPSSEYRNAAIKKGTHFQNDPTHGRGGMNLYYKKKGKHSRTDHQEPSETEPADDTQAPAPKNPAQPATSTELPASPGAGASKESPAKPAVTGDAPSSSDTSLPTSTNAGGNKKAPAVAQGSTSVEEPQSNTTDSDIDSAPAPVPAAPAAEPVVKTPSITDLSKKFALSKNWEPSPYGEWHDRTSGEKVAVDGYDGQVVPVNHPDRELLGVFIDRRKSTD